MNKDSSNIICKNLLFIFQILINKYFFKADDCPSEFKEIPFHTACLKPSVYVAKSGVTEEDKEIILRVHNEWRF